jgi:hypothetical protein
MGRRVIFAEDSKKEWEATPVAGAGRRCSSFGDGSRLPFARFSLHRPLCVTQRSARCLLLNGHLALLTH